MKTKKQNTSRETKSNLVFRTLEGLGECMPVNKNLSRSQTRLSHEKLMRRRGLKALGYLGAGLTIGLSLLYFSSDFNFTTNTIYNKSSSFSENFPRFQNNYLLSE